MPVVIETFQCPHTGAWYAFFEGTDDYEPDYERGVWQRTFTCGCGMTEAEAVIDYLTEADYACR